MKIVCTALLIFCFSLFLVTCKEKPVENTPVETKVTGRISEKSNSNPISGAIVSTSPSTSSVTTDGNGNYTINNVSNGQYIVSVSKDGYKPNSTTVSVKEGETSTADIQLEQLTPMLALSATTIDFGIAQTSLSFTISNSTQYGTLQWSIVKNADWLSVNPTSGTVSSGTSTVTLTTNRVGLAYGNYITTLNVTSNGGNKDISVTLTDQNPNAPQLTVTPWILDFGTTSTNLAFNIANTGTGKLTWVASPQQSWLNVSPVGDSTKTETDVVTMQVSRTGLPAGNYAGQVEVSSNAGNQTVTIQMSVSQPPTLALSTTSLDFGSTLSNLTFNISNSGTGTLNWSIASDRTWLTINPINGTNNVTVNVYVSRTGLSSGSYSGTLSVSSTSGNANVAVAMAVPTPSNPTAVTLNAPTNITTSSVVLSWLQNNDSDFKQYEVHKSTSAGFTPSSSTLVQTITNKSTISATVSGLTQGTTYYYKIRVMNTGNLFSDSNERSATTLSNPIAVTLNSPTNITTSSIDLSWTQNNDTDFKQYEVHKSTTAGFTPSSSTLVQTITSKTTISTTVTGLSQSTTYYFKIRIVNTGNLFSDSNERSATTLSNPTAVTLNSPTNITTSSIDLSWTQNNDSNFKQYELHKSTTVGFTPSSSTLVQTITSKTTISATVTGLSQNTTYYFKIRVVNTGNLFSDSNERSATTLSNPTAVTLNSPTNITTSSIDLSWTQNNDSNFKQYELHKSTTVGFTPSSSTLVQTITSKTTISATITGLSQSTTYYFKIRVVNTGNLFSDSNERNATTNSANTGPYTTDVNTIALYHFDETNGNTVTDASGNGHTGTANGTTIVTGKYGNARSFNSNYVALGNSLFASPPLQQTIEAWVKITNWTPPQGHIYYNGNDGEVSVSTSPDSTIFCSVCTSGGWTTARSGKLYPEIWYHVAAQYDFSTHKMRLYINGVLQEEIKIPNESYAGVNPNGDLRPTIGSYTNGTYFLGVIGIIDEVRISNKIRDVSEFHLQ